jgi:hypothetical protein
MHDPMTAPSGVHSQSLLFKLFVAKAHITISVESQQSLGGEERLAVSSFAFSIGDCCTRGVDSISGDSISGFLVSIAITSFLLIFKRDAKNTFSSKKDQLFSNTHQLEYKPAPIPMKVDAMSLRWHDINNGLVRNSH